MNARSQLELSPAEFQRLIISLFENFHQTHKLATSPLLETQWLYLSTVSGEYADQPERIRTLREAIRWAVEQLAPDSPNYPFGTYRPPDDPTWTDPSWWSYTLLRHRYIEPIPPDQFFEGTRQTGTLIALTGIHGRRAYYAELSRAFTRAAAIICDEIAKPVSSRSIQRRMLARVQDEAARVPSALAVLGIASVFTGAFPVRHLEEMARAEGTAGVFHAIEHLVASGCLLEVHDRGHLLLPPALREYIDRQQPARVTVNRHAFAARYAREAGQLPDQIRHLQRSGAQAEACALMIRHWGSLSSRCRFDDLLEMIDAFRQVEMTESDRVWVMVFRGSHLIRFGHFERARGIFLEMQQTTRDPGMRQLALIFLGHICSQIDPDAAFRYVTAAKKTAPKTAPFSRFLYSSMGRFHLSRGETGVAETCLLTALDAPEHPLLTFTSVLLFALMDLYILRGDYDRALKYAADAAAHAEAEQDAHLSAVAAGSLGSIHLERKSYVTAMRYLKQAETLHRQRFNLSEVARMLVAQGSIFCRTGQPDNAVVVYEEALKCYDRIGSAGRDRANVHKSLARLFAERHVAVLAHRHWIAAFRLATQIGLHEPFFEELEAMRTSLPELSDVVEPGIFPSSSANPHFRIALNLARRTKWVTTGSLIAEAGIGRTQAYSILTDLVQKGRPVRSGQGRATRYRFVKDNPGLSSATTIPEADIHYLSDFIMDWVRKVGFITTALVENRAGVSRATAKRALSVMVQAGVLQRTGRGRNSRYGLRF